MQQKNISDNAIVLSRINYGEKDRILSVLTEQNGKLKVLAKSVRAGKSKLAGGIELFAENHIVLVKGRSDLHTLISAKMTNYYGDKIVKDLAKSEFAYAILKKVNQLTPDDAGSEYYPYIIEALENLNTEADINQLKTYFFVKLLGLNGTTPNLKTLEDGSPLLPDKKYGFDFENHCFFVNSSGNFTADNIKILRYFDSIKTYKPILNCDEKLILQNLKLLDELNTT